jgi:hypothetical protein
MGLYEVTCVILLVCLIFMLLVFRYAFINKFLNKLNFKKEFKSKIEFKGKKDDEYIDYLNGSIDKMFECNSDENYNKLLSYRKKLKYKINNIGIVSLSNYMVISLTIFISFVSVIYNFSTSADIQSIFFNEQQIVDKDNKILGKDITEQDKQNLIKQQKKLIDNNNNIIKNFKDYANIDGNMNSLFWLVIDVVTGLAIVKIFLYKYIKIEKSFYLLCLDIIDDNIKIYELKQENKVNNLTSREIAATEQDDIEKNNNRRYDSIIKGFINIIHVKK